MEQPNGSTRELTQQQARDVCLRPGCGESARGHGSGRGLCPRDYRIAAAIVKNGQVTWEQLEAQGKTRPRMHKGGRPSTEVHDWLLAPPRS